jgi:hypothetical protein
MNKNNRFYLCVPCASAREQENKRTREQENKRTREQEIRPPTLWAITDNVMFKIGPINFVEQPEAGPEGRIPGCLL